MTTPDGHKTEGRAVRFTIEKRRFRKGVEVCYLTGWDDVEQYMGPIIMLEDLGRKK